MILYVMRYVQPTVHYTTTAPYYVPDFAIEKYVSLIWNEKFQEPGYFELYMRATPELFSYFNTHELMIVRPDTMCSMIVENTVLTTSAENGNYIKITGHSAESALNRRAIMQTGSWNSGTAEEAIEYFVKSNIEKTHYFSPGADEETDITFRFLPFLRYEIPANREAVFPKAIDAQPFGQNLGDFVSGVCKSCGYGYRIDFDKTKNEMVMRVYKGADRSLNQSVLSQVVFSSDFGNIGETEYTRDTTDYKNLVYIAGEGSGKNRVIRSATTVGLDMSDPLYFRAMGMTRRETFIDAKTISSNTDGIDGDMSKYSALLYGMARDEAEARKEKISFSVETLPSGRFLYRRDYFLGDIVSVRNQYGINGTATVSEIDEVIDETGHTIIPKLAEWRV